MLRARRRHKGVCNAMGIDHDMTGTERRNSVAAALVHDVQATGCHRGGQGACLPFQHYHGPPCVVATGSPITRRSAANVGVMMVKVARNRSNRVANRAGIDLKSILSRVQRARRMRCRPTFARTGVGIRSWAIRRSLPSTRPGGA